MRVATNFQNQSSLTQLQKANEELSKLTYQITTGNKASRLSELAGSSDEILNLRNIQRNTEIYVNNINTAKSRLTATESALQGLSNLLTDAASVSTLGRNENSAEARASLAPKAEALTKSFYNLFNTKFEGRYIFAGYNGSEAPTTATPTATTFPGSPPPTTYYAGDTAKPSIISGPGATLEYGITGDDAAFAGIKAGLEALWYGLQNNDVGNMDNAITTLQTAQKDLSGLLGQVGGQINNLDLQKQRHENNQSFIQERSDSLEKVDVSEALTQLTQQQATLQASMLVISRVNSLSLLDFIR